ncbi:MAG: polysaccharide biosynthesis/export family protein [Pyrinomonadaceae bacterium]
MSAIKTYSRLLILILAVAAALPVAAQEPPKESSDVELVPVASATPPETDGSTEATVDGTEDEDSKEVEKYYSNYLQEYRLGPQDIITVEVFGQCPDYCRFDAAIPPTARLSYPLIREGVFVGGKTTDEVAEDITKKLSEFIIDPNVTVTLVRVGSARYSVMGKVAAPGIRVMDRRISINEALLEAGGLAKGASKNKVFIGRFSSDGVFSQEQVDLEAIEKGKIPTIFLKPGDQIFVGEKFFTLSKVWNAVGQLSAARILFGSPF